MCVRVFGLQLGDSVRRSCREEKSLKTYEIVSRRAITHESDICVVDVSKWVWCSEWATGPERDIDEPMSNQLRRLTYDWRAPLALICLKRKCAYCIEWFACSSFRSELMQNEHGDLSRSLFFTLAEWTWIRMGRFVFLFDFDGRDFRLSQTRKTHIIKYSQSICFTLLVPVFFFRIGTRCAWLHSFTNIRNEIKFAVCVVRKLPTAQIRDTCPLNK